MYRTFDCFSEWVAIESVAMDALMVAAGLSTRELADTGSSIEILIFITPGGSAIQELMRIF